MEIIGNHLFKGKKSGIEQITILHPSHMNSYQIPFLHGLNHNFWMGPEGTHPL